MKSASFMVVALGLGGLVVVSSCTRSAGVQPAPVAPQVVTDIDTRELTALTRYLEKLFMVQEIHYSHPAHGYTYASDTARLYRFQPEPGVTFTILEGTQKGWAGIVQDGAGNACVVYIGAVTRLPATPRGASPDKPKRIVCDRAK